MSDERNDGDRMQRLLQMWARLASCLSDAGDGRRAERIRSEVLSRFRSAAPSRVGVWLSQAEALLAWREIAAECSPDRSGSAWTALQQTCEQLSRRVDEEQRAARSRFIGLLQQPKEQQALFADLQAFFAACHDVFVRLAAANPLPAGTAHPELQQEIEKLANGFPPGWPPACVASFVARVAAADRARFAGLPAIVRSQVETQGTPWRATLAEILPELPEELHDRILLVRGTLEALSASRAPAPAWPALGLLARELLPADRVQIEVVRDPRQPAEWFEAPRHDDVPAAAVERIGLVVRAAQRPWVGFPPGRLVLPQPGPPGFDELRSLLDPPANEAESAVWARLLDWRSAAAKGTLELAVVQFFVDFWGPLGDPLRDTEPEKAQEIAGQLAAVLQHEHKLFAFHPVAYQDHPDGWLQRLPGRNMVTGRVRRVIRPGLQDEHNQLRVPALVEVE